MNQYLIYGGIVLVVLFFVWLFYPTKAAKEMGDYFKERDKKKEEIPKIGIKATAKILSIGKAVKPGPYSAYARYPLVVEVQMPDGRVFEVSKSKFTDLPPTGEFNIQDRNAHFIQKDAVLPIVAHPENPEWFFFEFEME